MKKLTILMTVMLFTTVPFVAMADHNGESKAGTLFLFQKCDDTLKNTQGHDSAGCPNVGTGPWPIFPSNNRWGELDYSLWGDTFKFSFSGRGLLPSTNYTLIYYPDPWPGNRLICLGSGQSTPVKSNGKGGLRNHKQGRGQEQAGNIAIHGDMDIGPEGLPKSYDANFNPISPSGAVGAKIWLVLSDDVQCTAVSPDVPHMKAWNPTAYLFEYNLIVFEYRAEVPGDDNDDKD